MEGSAPAAGPPAESGGGHVLGRLRELDLPAAARPPLEWLVFAYRRMALDAQDLGVPASAIPQLHDAPTEAQLREARDRLDGIIASFASSGL